jgi:hypothetical protein
MGSLTKIKSLRDERDADAFVRNLFGMLNVLEHLIERLEDESSAFSSDDLARYSFRYYHDEFSAFLASAPKQSTLKKLYPGHADLAAHVADILPTLDSISKARYAIFQHYMVDTKDDLQRDELAGVHGLSKEDRAGMMGLSTDQLAAYDAQLDRFGHFNLSMTERMSLASAMRDALEAPPVKKSAGEHIAQRKLHGGTRGASAPSVD